MRRFRFALLPFEEKSAALEEVKTLLAEVVGVALPGGTHNGDFLPNLLTALLSKKALIEGDEADEQAERDKEVTRRQEDADFFNGTSGKTMMALGRMKMATVATAYLNKADADRKARRKQASEDALFGAGGSPNLGSGPSHADDSQGVVDQLFRSWGEQS